MFQREGNPQSGEFICNEYNQQKIRSYKKPIENIFEKDKTILKKWKEAWTSNSQESNSRWSMDPWKYVQPFCNQGNVN